jgi:hypothetical protein
VTPTAAGRTTQEPIPGYKLVQRIGAGGYGEVWTAEAPGQLTKAIKFVYGLLDEDRAARELKALNRIKGVRHPFLLSLERIEVVDGQLLIVTELAECSLKDRFEQCRKEGLPGIPREELLRYLRDAADALDYMNEQHGLQHLDVKPENLLLVAGRIKVADFGLVKDIHDATVSMMGGLTPIYAPPEVFEGRPSRRSDQYSLAIVYQEMLTGALPFPGRTAAQLAAQHLNAKPRLAALPGHDQPIVARALAKKPAERFANCRELITALSEAPARCVPAAAPAVSSPAPPDAGRPATIEMLAATTPPARGAMPTAPRQVTDMLAGVEAACQAVHKLASPEAVEATEVVVRPKPGTPSRDAASSPPQAPPPEAGLPPRLETLAQMPPLAEVPPPQVLAPAAVQGPTLYVGLGGWGCKVLSLLRPLLVDGTGTPDSPRWWMLGIDSDSKASPPAHPAERSARLPAEEMLLTPLRRSQDYRSESGVLLHWLSRRWLYNIPRSQQTEGWRPLGRLALVDHAALVSQRLRPLVAELASAMSAGRPPRVVLVASANGGTGSGMLADVAALVRQLADELWPGGRLHLVGVLVHGTGRHLQQQELARANAVATLTELAHFHGPAGFPGDPACGLKPRSAQEGILDALYLIDAGDDLSPAQIDAACAQAAQFLFRDLASAAGSVLEACRQEPSSQKGLTLRSVGVACLGLAHDGLVEAAAAQLSRQVLRRWIEGPQGPEARKTPRLLAAAGSGGRTGSEEESAPDPLTALTQRAAALVRTMGLDVQPLTSVVQQFASAELGGDPEAFFRSLMVTSPQGEPLVERWVAAAGDLFGRQHGDNSLQAQPGELAEALDERLAPWIQQVGGGLREWIEAIVDDPQGRIRGARHAAAWFQQYLRGLMDRLGETRGQLIRQIETVAQSLAATEIRNGQPRRRTVQELSTTFLQYCRLRLFELCVQRAGRIAHALQGHTMAAQDLLADLQRAIEQLATMVPEATAGDSPEVLRPLRDEAASQLHAAREELVQQVEEQMSQTLLASWGSLRAVATCDAAGRQSLLEALRRAAREAACAKVQTLDLAGVLLSSADGDSPLAEALKAARPRLACCGGRLRLICLTPPSLAEAVRQALAASAKSTSQSAAATAALVPAEPGDLALIYELGDLSLPHVAAHLLDFRPDLAQAASRLHTRCDVNWTRLVAV